MTIGVNNLPSHTHTGTFSPSGSTSSVSIAIPVVASGGTPTDAPGGNYLGYLEDSGGNTQPLYNSGTSNAALKVFSVSVPGGGGTVTNSNTGSGQALAVSVAVPVTVSTMQPYVKLNYVIATQGIYPQRE